MTSLAELYASGSVEPWHTLSIIHPGLPDGGLHWVRRWLDPLTATIETGAEIEFQPAGFEVTLPQRGATGQQQLQFTVSNVTGEVRRHVEAVRAAGGEIQVVYRAWLPTDISTPARVLRMTAISVATKQATASITAVFKDSVNARWPRLVYNQERFPGLAWVGG